MACAITSESRRLYSWLWDSHISPKNSKWLQENLTDMDTKVKSMIKLIEVDADSFARRAEMYYKKRPELMKLVEEFYRAYRALAERYDYATSELRHAHKTLQAAFPDQEPFTLPEDLSSSVDPDAQKRASFVLQLFLDENLQNTNEKDECEVERLKKAVADLIAEKDSLFVRYQSSLEKLSNADGELNRARESLRILEEKANKAENEVRMLKETVNGMDQRAVGLETISDLEKKIAATEEEAKTFAEQAVKAEMEVEKLKTALLEITNEKEALRVLYAECLEKSHALELELASAQSDVQRLTTEILNSAKKLKHVEEICVCLETSNDSLKMEVSDLAKIIMLKDQELSDKHDELKNTEVEIVGLKQMKERLEDEVALKSGQCAAMQKEIFDLKEEITKLSAESFASSVKYLQDENSRLNADLQSSSESFHVEKSALVLQKTVLENSLSAANIELEKLKERSKGLEELCELLSNEKSNLLKESVQKRLEVLENRFMHFEKEKETGNSRMLELVSSSVGKQEHESCLMMDQRRLHDLEIKLTKQELQEELDKAVIAQFENFILQKYVKEVEEENHCLSVENRKHIEASKLADRLISELETEILEQQVEEELLLVQVENLRLGINQVFLSLGVGSKSNDGKISIEEIIDNIKDLKRSLLKEEDDKQRVLIENTVISTVLLELELHKKALMNKYETMKNDFSNVKKENRDLIEANASLGLELVMLDEEVEQQKTVQANLTSELLERENELEASNAEATKCIIDLQVSNTRGVVFESKANELAKVCAGLEGETAAKDREIEELKRNASVMEREIEGLKAQLLAYTPVIGSLKENISCLEHNLGVTNNRKAEVQDVELKVHSVHNQHDQESTHGPKSLEPNGISDLIELQTRIAAIEKVIVEDINTVSRRRTSGVNVKPKPAKTETEDSKSTDHQKRNKEDKLRGKRYLTLDHLNIPKAKPEFLEMRDIPLDQASDGSSSANSRSRSRRGYLRSDDMLLDRLQTSHKSYKTETKACKLPYEPQSEDVSVYKLQVSNQEAKKGKLLQRLVSDAHKLSVLESTVKDLTQRLEAGKKSKKQNMVDFKIVKEQLEEAGKTISQLANVNVESTANVDKYPSLAAWLEQDDTLKRSERIKAVQLDVQNIQSVLLKLDDEKKSKVKSRYSVSKSRTSVMLRDFIHHGGRSRRRRLCACFAPATPSMTKSDRVKS
ncbi:hypothetical protein M8C21_012276 [Ambrosia artemisiifolia]|uniref:NAB domain-containing protein n=1 Tax=Ambrosia artemisiifolia TaxID=4212 RepID=A0AAD5G5F2_AMBAR|nr:hypothetical protein M8C21_012276 [Ambrosia artemisiifolia]